MTREPDPCTLTSYDSRVSSTYDPSTFEPTEAFALRLDAADPLAAFRRRFAFPQHDGRDVIYLAGNSLGLMPHAVRDAVGEELDTWARHAVDGHFEGPHPWYPYHELFRDSCCRLVGARPEEVVVMNTLTANLHLMMVSFYRPTASRFKILMEDTSFPSDTYAVQSQLRWHGYNPHEGLLRVRPREGEHLLRTEDIERMLAERGDEIALVLFAGVNYYTGQAFDLERIATAARRAGCVVGFDLAHAAGNLPLSLHDWDVDFACWCSYKYLNGGPGCVAGTFVHARHVADAGLPRFAGWWGNDPETRFRMHLNETFAPVASADAWQLSNPPVLALAALRASLAIFDEAGMAALRAKSLRLTGYLLDLLDRMAVEGGGARGYEVITPRTERARGCQVSLLVHGDRPRSLQERLQGAGVISDFRPPNVVRVAPVPLYNSFHDVWRFAALLQAHAEDTPG